MKNTIAALFVALALPQAAKAQATYPPLYRWELAASGTYKPSTVGIGNTAQMGGYNIELTRYFTPLTYWQPRGQWGITATGREVIGTDHATANSYGIANPTGYRIAGSAS